MRPNTLLRTIPLAQGVVAIQSYEAWLDFLSSQSPKQCHPHAVRSLRPDESGTTCPLLVDDETSSQTNSWDPWTFPPVCVQDDKATGSKLCTFTYASLRGETGISIITTPENMAAGIGVLDDVDAVWDEWARGCPLAVAHPPPYEIREIEDKGLGVVANRTIRPGEVVMIQYPIVLRAMDTESWRPRDALNLLHRASVQLPPRDRARMTALAHSKGGYILDDIMNTNSFGVLLDGVDHQGLYPEVSRINHACKPNLFSRFSSTTLAMEVVAYRGIEAGEELTFSYLPLNLLSNERQSHIRTWGFNCTCSLCSSPNELAVSDRQRGRIQDILAELDQPQTRNHAAVDVRVQEVVGLCREEGMAAQVGDLYSIIADVYSSMGDLDLARQYGQLVVQELRYYAGYDHKRTSDAILQLESFFR